ncbi:MAG: DUF3179 domain-containing protein [Acidobacteria bacterium]|nr:DUF3179 domain-containing protein [Acidobacteriota bacterium]
MVRVIAVFLVSAVALWGQFARGTWKTDLSKKSIDLSELLSGGPPKDGIPAILNPKFVSVEEANGWLAPSEPVLMVKHAGEARAYPLQILIFHELANDQIADLPILVSYCPLCNSAITFDRRIDGQTHTFGVSGMLRNSDMVMYDHQTDSLWQQLTGDSLVGEHTGKQLKLISSQVVPWNHFAENFRDAKVLSRDTGYENRYGTTPYGGYEFSNRLMFPVTATRKADVRPMERMLTLILAGNVRAYPFEHLRRNKVTEGKLNDRPYVVFYEPTALSTMDARTIADSRAVGSAGVFSPMLDGEKLKFQFKNGKTIDKGTKSSWDIFGKAIDGPLAGKQLDSIEHGIYYAFALLAFYPRAELVGLREEALRIPAGAQQPQQPPTGTLGGQPPFF